VTRILLVDDDAALIETLQLDLSRRGYGVRCSSSAAEALATLQANEIDVVVTDLAMPATTGIELCERISGRRPDIPVIVLTAFGSFDTAVAAIRAGAYDFISKPVRLEVLAIAIDRAAKHRSLREQVRVLERDVHRRPEVAGLVTASSAMRAVIELADRVAQSDATVLITGESGSGKEVIARMIHEASRRKDKPFVAINCAAVPESLLESELFGHVRGAFTDARSSEPGLFLSARGGTVFLDEIGDMPLSVQPKLLRVLQERTIRAVGSNSERAIDVRVIAATNQDLESAIEDGRFRDDLYYRVNVVHIELPPLRSRRADVLPLAVQFIEKFAKNAGKAIKGVAPAAAERLVAYRWPGNVRELQNCIEHAVALARYDQIALDDLPPKVRDYRPEQLVLGTDDPADFVPLEQLERQYIARVMEAVAGNKSAAARVLGVDRKRLYRMLERLRL
jgi:two-component system response regulator HydG